MEGLRYAHDDLHVLLRHRPLSIPQATRLAPRVGRGGAL